MPERNNQPDKKVSGIDKLSEATRKKILIISVSLITLVLLATWAKNFGDSIQSVVNEKPSSEFTEVLEKTRQGAEQISEEIGKIKEATKILENLATSTPTTTPNSELSQEEIDKLKEKILERQTNQMATTTEEMKKQP